MLTKQRMDVIFRFFRTTAFLPIALAGLISVIFAQTTLIFGAIFVGMAAPELRRAGKSDVGRNEADPAAPFVHRPPEDSDPQAIALLPLVSIVPDSLILLRDEQCYLQEHARLDVRDEPVPAGAFSGFSIRNRHDGLAKRPKRRSSTGRVFVTNMRIVFIGTGNVNMHIAQILTLDALPDGVSLSFINEQPMQIITGNARIAYVLRKSIARLATPDGPLS